MAPISDSNVLPMVCFQIPDIISSFQVFMFAKSDKFFVFFKSLTLLSFGSCIVFPSPTPGR